LGDRFVIGFYNNNSTGGDEKKKNGETYRFEARRFYLIRLRIHSKPPDRLKVASPEIPPFDR
jgi:hypothetical protein